MKSNLVLESNLLNKTKMTSDDQTEVRKIYLFIFTIKNKMAHDNEKIVSTLYGTFGSRRFEFLPLHLRIPSKLYYLKPKLKQCIANLTMFN